MRQHMADIKHINPLTAGATYIRVLIFFTH